MGARVQPFVNIYRRRLHDRRRHSSALRYSIIRRRVSRGGQRLIAAGAILPGIAAPPPAWVYGVLYVTELAGLLLTWMGYRMSIRRSRCPRRLDPIGQEHAAAVQRTAFGKVQLTRAPGRGGRDPGAEQHRVDGEPDLVDDPACNSEVARLPPLITMMSLPGCAFSLRTKSPASPLTSSCPFRTPASGSGEEVGL